MLRPSRAPLLLADERPSAEGPALPFLKWAGGKRAVLAHLRPRLLPVQGRYHEPFLGGGAVFLALASEGAIRAGATLSDANPRLIATWRAVRDRPEALLQRLAAHAEAHGREHFLAQRERDIDAEDEVEQAAWMIYLNKSGFNGLYRVNRTGRFNVPFGRCQKPAFVQPGRIRAVSRLLQGVELLCQDFEATLESVGPHDTVYLDPPYLPNRPTGFTCYTVGGFGLFDQRRLARRAVALRARGCRVVVSNHAHPLLDELYPSPPFMRAEIQVARPVNRDVTRRGAVAEVILW